MSDYDRDDSCSSDSTSQYQDTPSMEVNHVAMIGYTSAAVCGYCKAKHQNFSYYAQTTSISADFYQTLADMSWRRSGSVLYRPDPRLSCCPHYTIRLDSLQYKPSRNQRQAVNTFNRYILGKEYIKMAARLHPLSRAEAKHRDNHFDFPSRIHEAEYCNRKGDLEPEHKLEITLENDDFTEEKYQLYLSYQMEVHRGTGAPPTRDSFQKFLCFSPIRRGKYEDEEGTERDVGTFHQCYRIDGKLVAVGVLDLMASCVSSVYFFYDKSITKFSPGKLSAMMEISFARQRGYRWWYAGYFIDSNAKMQYKMDFQPQFILDVEEGSFQYIKVDEKVRQILKGPYRPILKSYRCLASGDTAGYEALQDPISRMTRMQRIKMIGWEGDAHFTIPLFETDMPGIPSIQSIKNMDMDNVMLCLKSTGKLYRMADMVGWENQVVRSRHGGLKTQVAELVVALGGMEILERYRVAVEKLH